jgi:hypothetical protein
VRSSSLTGGSNRASINVDPGRVQIGVEAEREANGIAVTTAPINAGAVTSIPVTNAQTLTLRDGDHLIVTDRTGAFVDLTVTGEQSVTSGTTVINASGTATAGHRGRRASGSTRMESDG